MELCRLCKVNYVNKTTVNTQLNHIILINKLKYINIYKISLDTFFCCGIITITVIATLKETDMDKRQSDNSKEEALRGCGALNTHPVTDALFKDNDFFDPRDLVQVKYEMLRKVHREKESISHVAASFGFSRPSFYKTSADFEREGIAGLLPRKRGPRSGYKLTEEVLEFIEEICTTERPMGIPALLDEVEKRFGIRVHRRSLERARQRCEKKTVQTLGEKERKPRSTKTMP